MSNTNIRVEWLKIGNLGGDEIIAPLGSAQNLSVNTSSQVTSTAAPSGTSIGYPVANNAGCFCRVTAIDGAIVVISSNTFSGTLTEDLGVRVDAGHTVLLKSQTGYVLTAIQSAVASITNDVGTVSLANNTVNVQGKTSSVTVTPTVNTSAYTANYEVGGLMTFASVVGTVGSGLLQSVRLNCKSTQTTTFKLFLFNTNPANTTWTDHAAPAIVATDVPSIIEVVYLTTAESGLGTHTFYSVDSIGKSFVIPSGNSLYGVLTTTGTPTFASNSDISVTLNVIQD